MLRDCHECIWIFWRLQWPLIQLGCLLKGLQGRILSNYTSLSIYLFIFRNWKWTNNVVFHEFKSGSRWCCDIHGLFSYEYKVCDFFADKNLERNQWCRFSEVFLANSMVCASHNAMPTSSRALGFHEVIWNLFLFWNCDFSYPNCDFQVFFTRTLPRFLFHD